MLVELKHMYNMLDLLFLAKINFKIIVFLFKIVGNGQPFRITLNFSL